MWRLQVIRYFARETDLPLTLGLLVDTSLSQRQVLGEEQDASRRFIEKVLREDRDQTFLIHFDHDTELLQDLTSSRNKLERALNDLELPDDAQPQLNRGGGGYPGGGGGYPGGGGGSRGRSNLPGTTLYDAVLLASDELMKKQQGRKAFILLTDGVDNGSRTPLYQAIESAQRSDTLVYSIYFTGEEGRPQTPFSGGLGGYDGLQRRWISLPPGNRLTGRTARRFCSRCPARRAAGISKFRRKRLSMTSTTTSRKSFAINTAWATHQIEGTRAADSAGSPSPSKTRG